MIEDEKKNFKEDFKRVLNFLILPITISHLSLCSVLKSNKYCPVKTTGFLLKKISYKLFTSFYFVSFWIAHMKKMD